MAPKCVLSTELTESMIKEKVLYFPTGFLWTLPPVQNERDPVEFPVNCGEKVYTFRCRKRLMGASLKPVIQKGWSNVINDKALQEGDLVELYYMAAASVHEPARYWIEVRRCVRHEDAMGTTLEWQRII